MADFSTDDPHSAASHTGTIPAVVTYTYAPDHGSDCETRTTSWPDFATRFTTHKQGEKAGPLVTQGVFRTGKRHLRDTVSAAVMLFDFDGTHTEVQIVDPLRRHGLSFALASSYSHGKTRTEVKLVDWEKWTTAHPDGTAEQFLLGKGYHPSWVKGAAAFAEGETVVIEHQPKPCFHVAVPLVREHLTSNYPTQDAANEAWREQYMNVAAGFGWRVDSSIAALNQPMYLPRHDGTRQPEATFAATGGALDLATVVRAEPAADARPAEPGARHRRQRTFEEQVKPDHIMFGDFDLTTWAAQRGNAYMLATALERHAPHVLTGHVAGDKVHILCPNGAEHSNGGEMDAATFVCDAGDNGEGFRVHCLHDHCRGMDRLEFVRLMLEQGWLTVAHLLPPGADDDDDGPRIYTFGTDANPYSNIRWLVYQLIGGEVGIIAAPYAHGKTFVGMDLAACLWDGTPFAGHDVELRCGTLWWAAEGAFEVPYRAEAIKRERQQREELRIKWIDDVPNILDPAGEARFIAGMNRADAAFRKDHGVPLGVTIIDTKMAAVQMAGKDATAETNAMMQAATRIFKATGVLVIFIDHMGKDPTKGIMGSVVSANGADFLLYIRADGDDDSELHNRRIWVEKMRGARARYEIPFALKTVNLGVDEKGRAVSSCVVEWADLDQPAAVKTGRPPDRTLDLYRSVITDILTRDGAGHGRSTRDLSNVVAHAMGSPECPISPETVRGRGGPLSRLIAEGFPYYHPHEKHWRYWVPVTAATPLFTAVASDPAGRSDRATRTDPPIDNVVPLAPARRRARDAVN